MARSKLANILLKEGLLSEGTLQPIEQKAPAGEPWRLGELLIQYNMVPEDTLKMAVSTLTKAPAVILSQLRIPGYVAKMLPREEALRYLAIPVTLKTEGGTEVLYVAFFDPSSEEAVAGVEKIVRRRVKPIIAGYKELRAAIDRHLKPLMDSSTAKGFETQQSQAAIPMPPKPAPPRKAVVTPPPKVEEEEELDFSGITEDSYVGRKPLSADEALEEIEMVAAREVSATDIEMSIQQRHQSDTSMQGVVDLDNSGPASSNEIIPPDSNPRDDISDIFIPSATEMLSLPQVGAEFESSDRSPEAGAENLSDSRTIDYGFSDDMGELELPDERETENYEDDLSLDIDALYSNIGTSAAGTDKLQHLDRLFEESDRAAKKKKPQTSADALSELEKLATNNNGNGKQQDADVTFIYEFISGDLPEFEDPNAKRLAQVINALLRLLIAQGKVKEIDFLKAYFKQ